MNHVLVLRGLPGVGKSTLAKQLIGVAGYGAIVASADDFFMRDGEYRFDVSKLAQAHQWCWRKFFASMQESVPLIIVDNTNTTAAECAPYILPAEASGYQVTAVEVTGLDMSARELSGRNTHGVPEHTIVKMMARFEELPPYVRSIRWIPSDLTSEAAEDRASMLLSRIRS